MLHLKILEQEKAKHKTSRRREIIKIRNEMETNKKTKESMKQKSLSLRR
jgi:hypothetical protein